MNSKEKPRENNFVLENIFAKVKEGVTLSDEKGHFEIYNPEMESLTGYSMEEANASFDFMKLLYPDPADQRRALDGIKELMEKGTSLETEATITAKGGSSKRVFVSSSIILHKGRRMFLSIFRDITKLDRAIESLRQIDDLNQSLLRTIPFYMDIVDEHGGLLFINKKLEDLVGGESVGKKCWEIYKDDKRQCGSCPLKQGVNIGETKSVETSGAFGGKTFRVNHTGMIYNGKKAILEIFQDITEEKEADKKLDQINKEVMRSNKKLERLTLRDPHTGLYNYRFLEDFIEAEFSRSKRQAHPLSAIMIDLDYFKSINDVYGHQFGDLILKQFASQLKKMVRRYDTVIRFGGEEFVIICSGTDREDVITLSKRLLDAINLYNFGNKETSIKLKLTMAVASYPEDRITKGMDLIELSDRILNKAKERGGNRVYSSLDIKKRGRYSYETDGESADVQVLKEKLGKLTKRANQSLIEAVFAFAKTIELKDHYTGSHVESSVHYAEEVSKILGLPKDEVERIRKASQLHDLGKIGISEKILHKKSKLTKEEFEEIKHHPQIAADILRPIHSLHDIIPLILHHHERWDGKGYPHGLKGNDIPMGARIIAIADVYQALITNRPYRKRFKKEDAINIIKEESGTHFDPKVVSAFLKITAKEK